MALLHSEVLASVAQNELAAFRALLAADPSLVRSEWPEDRLLESGIFHWMYAGDTYLHLAAAGYRTEIARELLQAGADPNARGSRRKSRPLHYAADGFITGPAWNPNAQVQVLNLLLDFGADLGARDSNGATALHRAVRTRCASAVEVLLQRGASPTAPNSAGSTSFHLAVQQTGRGGSGDPIALDAQRKIIESFTRRGVSAAMKDGRGLSVRDQASRSWAISLLPDGDA